MKKLYSRLLPLCLLLLVSWSHIFSQEYTISETELTQLEENNETIKKSLELLQKASQEKEQILTDRVVSLSEQLKITQESWEKCEREKKILYQIIIPIMAMVASGCFIGGAYVGISM